MAGPVGKVVQLKIELCDISPRIWRRVAVPSDLSLRRLHDVIQAVFGWLDCHLHQFEVGDRVYGQTEIAGEDYGPGRQYSDRNVTVGALVDRGFERFVYRYDFGDDWEHVIAVERVGEPERGVEYPVLLEGARRGPPEDCGGPPGFERFLEAMASEAHEEHEDLMDWYGEPFDPDDVDPEVVEAMLGRIRAGRRKGPAKGSPSSSKKVWTRRG